MTPHILGAALVVLTPKERDRLWPSVVSVLLALQQFQDDTGNAFDDPVSDAYRDFVAALERVRRGGNT